MQSVKWQPFGLAAIIAVALAGCGKDTGAKIDITTVADNQVALNVEGMV